MRKILKVISIIVGAIFVLVVLPIIILTYVFTSAIIDTFTPAYENGDILEYVEKTHGFEVEVISNAYRSPLLAGIFMFDAVVETIEEDPIQFNIHVSTFGKITGDDYEEVKLLRDLNLALEDSESYQGLENKGFSDIHIRDDHDFSMNLPQERKLGDKETLQMLYEALPIIKKWQSKALEKNVGLDTVYLQGVRIDLELEYSSWKNLGDILATENIDYFTSQFIERDRKNVVKIEEDLHELGFNLSDTVPPSDLDCYKMKVYDKCAAYSLTLYTDDADDNDDFQYDDLEDIESLLNAIQLLNHLDLPLEKVIIDSIYAPYDPENQIYMVEELEAREEYIGFSKWEATITNLKEITSIDDIYFEYRE